MSEKNLMRTWGAYNDIRYCLERCEVKHGMGMLMLPDTVAEPELVKAMKALEWFRKTVDERA